MEKRTIHRGHDGTLLVEIIDKGDERSLRVAGAVLHSAMSISSPQRLALSYTRYMMAPLLFNDSPTRVLVVGIGAGSLIRYINHHLPDCLIDGIDNSSYIIKLARGYFHLPEEPRVFIHCRDGYDFLAGLAPEKGYDLILLDAFNASGMSDSIYCSEFFALCRDHLHPQGIVSLNLWSGDKTKMVAVKAEVSDHFTSLLTLPVPHRGNVICLASATESLAEIMMRTRDEIAELSARFDIDFKSIVSVCGQNNLGPLKRLTRLFS